MTGDHMKCNASPYQGSEKFIFFSYCHKDSEKVYPMIEELTQKGFRIWFDDGISIGDEWPQVISEKLEKCAVFVPAISPAYCDSHNCKNELTYQVEDRKTILPLMLENMRLIGGIRLQLANCQHLRLYEHAKDQWADAVASLPQLQECKGEPTHPPVPIPPPPVPTPDPPVPGPLPPKPNRPFIAVGLTDGEVRQAVQSTIHLSTEKDVTLIEDSVSVSYLNSDKAAKTIYGQLSTTVANNQSYAIAWDSTAKWLLETGLLHTLTFKKTGETNVILQEGLALGRYHKNEWISGAMKDPRMGREHGDIKLKNGKAIYTDHSKNGTYINDHFLLMDGEQTVDDSALTHVLQDCDILILGDEHFIYRAIPLKEQDEKRKRDYTTAKQLMQSAATEQDYQEAEAAFEALDGYLDSVQLSRQCHIKAEECRKDNVYMQAQSHAAQLSIAGMEEAIKLYSQIKGWKDTEQLISQYKLQLENLRKQEEAYYNACSILDAAEEEADVRKAEQIFVKLGDYRDSGSKQLECASKINALKQAVNDGIYKQAMHAYECGDYENAMDSFRLIPQWKQSEEFIRLCEDKLYGGRTVLIDEWNERTLIERKPLIENLKTILVIDLSNGEIHRGKWDSTVIGRKTNQADIVFPNNNAMSRRHAEIFAFDGKHYIRDCDSTNGTTVDGIKLEKSGTVSIGNVALLTVAQMNLLVALGKEAVQLAQRRSLAYIIGSDGKMEVVQNKPLALHYEDIEATVIEGRIGSSIGAEILLDGKCAVLRALSDCVAVENVSLDRNACQPLTDGDTIQVGNSTYRYHSIPLIDL